MKKRGYGPAFVLGIDITLGAIMEVEWTVESAVHALGDDAQVVPGGVIKLCIDSKTGQQAPVVIFSFSTGVAELTSEGKRVLDDIVIHNNSMTQACMVPSETACVAVPTRRTRRTKAEMEAARALPTALDTDVVKSDAHDGDFDIPDYVIDEGDLQ